MRSFSKGEGVNIYTLTVLDHDPEEERLVEVEDQQDPEETDAVLLVEGLNFPVEVTKRIFEESSDVLEGSPLLCHITRLSCGNNKLSEITISLLSECSIKYLLNFESILCTCQSCQLSR